MKSFLLFISLLSILSCKDSLTKATESQENIRPRFFWSVDWKEDSSQIVVGGTQDTLRLFSSDNFQIIKNYPYKGTITKTKWHPTKNKLAISVQDGISNCTILNFDNDKSIILDSVSRDGARAIAWNHTGDLLVVGDYDGYLTIFDDAGNFIKRMDTGQKGIIGLDWHPKENLIAAVGEKITLYDYEGNKLNHIHDRSEKVEVLMLCVAWHPSGDFFVTGDYGDFQYNYPPLLQFWNYDGTKIRSIEESKAEFRNMKWSSDGTLLATASEKIRLWNKDGKLIKEQATKSLLWGIDWNADASQVVATDLDGRILFWDKELKLIKQF